jgi:hypothetical protein
VYIDSRKWVTSNVMNMNMMFSGAASFNHDISGWEINKYCNITNMFGYVESAAAWGSAYEFDKPKP